MLATLIGYALFAQVAPLEEAKRLEQAGQLAPAIEILEASTGEAPDLIDAGRYLAWLYGKAGQQDAAIAEYQRLVRRFPKETDLHNSLGALLFRQHRFEEALASFRKLLELNPHHAEGSYYVGMILRKLGRDEDPRHAFEDVLYDGAADVLYRNDGDGTFTDVSSETGVAAIDGKGLGVIFTDVEQDGDADIYLANDSVMNLFFRNVGDECLVADRLLLIREGGEPLSW